jgi:hypothetical protein
MRLSASAVEGDEVTDDLVDALREVLRATAEDEAAKDRGHFGSSLIEARQRAEEAFSRELDALIDARVQLALSKLGDQT